MMARYRRILGLRGRTPEDGSEHEAMGSHSVTEWCIKRAQFPFVLTLGGYCAAALFAAHRFLMAAMIAFRPAAESFRFLGAAEVPAPDCRLESAHLLRCASAIRARLAALIFRRLCFSGSGAAAFSTA